jgi:hypothetical protein
MRASLNVVDSCSPAHIAEAIVKVNQVPELRGAGLGVLWKLYYAAEHSLTRLELERAFGELEDTSACTVVAFRRSWAPQRLMRYRL